MANTGTWIRPTEHPFGWRAKNFAWRIDCELAREVEAISNDPVALEMFFMALLAKSRPELKDAMLDMVHYDANRNCYMVRAIHQSLAQVQMYEQVPFEWADRPETYNDSSGQYERQHAMS